MQTYTGYADPSLVSVSAKPQILLRVLRYWKQHQGQPNIPHLDEDTIVVHIDSLDVFLQSNLQDFERAFRELRYNFLMAAEQTLTPLHIPHFSFGLEQVIGVGAAALMCLYVYVLGAQHSLVWFCAHAHSYRVLLMSELRTAWAPSNSSTPAASLVGPLALGCIALHRMPTHIHCQFASHLLHMHTYIHIHIHMQPCCLT